MMDIAYWMTRWKEGRIGFHEGRTNAFLARHADHLGPAPRRVLVPLCGKAEDMAFLASRGHSVVGIELVEEAVQAFFREHGLEPVVRDRSERVRSYTSGAVTLLAGDLFACGRDEVGPVDALYDRAALIALAPDVRARYVPHVRGLLSPSATGLVVTFDYDQTKVSGPPYAVGEEELRRLYAGAAVTRLDEERFDSPKFGEAADLCYAIRL